MNSHLTYLLRNGKLPTQGRLYARYQREMAPVPIDPQTKDALTEQADPAFVLSTDGEAADGHIVQQYWDLSRVSGGGVPLLWMHRAGELLGQWHSLEITDYQQEGAKRALIGRTRFDKKDPIASNRERQVRDGFLNAVSVRWEPGELVRRGDLPKDHPWYREPQDDWCGEPAEGFVMGSERQPNLLVEGSLVTIGSDARAIATERLFGGSDLAAGALMRGEDVAPANLSRLKALMAQDPEVRAFLRRAFIDFSREIGASPETHQDDFFQQLARG